jgi:hypothetical protein
MPNHLHEWVRKLNRVSQLYEYSIRNSNAYRVGRIRELYQNVLQEVTTVHRIEQFNSKTYQIIFDQNEILESIIYEKEKALSIREYELAATLRDKEKRLLRSLLKNIGVDITSQFFHHKDIIYQLK